MAEEINHHKEPILLMIDIHQLIEERMHDSFGIDPSQIDWNKQNDQAVIVKIKVVVEDIRIE